MRGVTYLGLVEIVMGSTASGLFAFALFFFLRAWASMRNRAFVSLFLIAANSMLYSLLGLVLALLRANGASAVVCGMALAAQELCPPFLLFLGPYFLSAFYGDAPSSVRVNRVLAMAGLAISLFTALAALFAPTAFLSGFALVEGGLESKKGWLFFASRVPIAPLLLYVLASMGADLLRGKRRPADGFLFAGTAIASLFAISSIWRIATGSYLDPFHAIRFPRVETSLIVFGAIVSAGFIRRFLSEAGETDAARGKVRNLLLNDPLTGLPNKRSFLQDLESLRSRGESRAVVLVDIDNFLDLNDSYGMETGDSLLAALPSAIAPLLPPGARQYRIGGDEIAFLLPAGAGPGEALSLIENARSRLRAGIVDEAGHPHPLECSSAVAFAGNEAPEKVLANAYSCLREAKREGRPAKVFSPEWHEASLERIEAVHILRQDIAARRLSLEYQPIHDARRRVVAAEALLRWNSGSRYGGPARFIPLAESAGLMVSLGKLILELLVDDLSGEMRAPGFPLISLNLSPAQLMDPGCYDDVVDRIEGAGLTFAALQFEVTESMFLEKGSRAVSTLSRLRDRGSPVAIDDFGSGYSNLGYLRYLPADKIKIDRGFVSSLPGDAAAASMLRSIAEIGRSAGMELLAEGVESSTQFEHLRAEGIAEFQGFYFSRPLPKERFMEYLALQTALAR